MDQSDKRNWEQPLKIINAGFEFDNENHKVQSQLVDEDGDAFGVKHADNKLRVSSIPYLYDVAEGNITGHSDFYKLGYNGDIGAAEEDMWEVGGEYVFPTAEMGMEIVSSDNTQDKAGGTGALTVSLHYLDSDFVNHTTSKALNGTTPVALDATDIYRIIDFHLETTGSGGKAVGNVDVRHLSDTPIYARIAAGYTASRNGLITVPSGKAMYVVLLNVGSGGSSKPTQFTLRATYIDHDEEIVTFFMPYGEVLVTEGNEPHLFPSPLYFPTGVDIKVSAKGGATSAITACAIRGWVEDV